MEIRTSEEVMEHIEAYAGAVLELQLQKKELDGKIADIKQDAKENGVAIGKVMKVVSAIKADSKLTEADALEEELIRERLEKSTKINDQIGMLLAK